MCCFTSGGTFPNYNPSNGDLITNVANGTSEDIDLAVAAAKRCLHSEHWGSVSQCFFYQLFSLKPTISCTAFLILYCCVSICNYYFYYDQLFDVRFASTGKQRAAILRKLKVSAGLIIHPPSFLLCLQYMIQDAIIDRKDEIALLDSLDMGKAVREALADLGDAIGACDHFANLAEEQVNSPPLWTSL
jgi:hypothetical protein